MYEGALLTDELHWPEDHLAHDLKGDVKDRLWTSYSISIKFCEANNTAINRTVAPVDNRPKR